MLKLYDVVKLKEDREDIGVKATFCGTVIDYVKEDDVYSVEFMDEENETCEEALYTYFKESELELISSFQDT